MSADFYLLLQKEERLCGQAPHRQRKHVRVREIECRAEEKQECGERGRNREDAKREKRQRRKKR